MDEVIQTLGDVIEEHKPEIRKIKEKSGNIPVVTDAVAARTLAKSYLIKGMGYKGNSNITLSQREHMFRRAAKIYEAVITHGTENSSSPRNSYRCPCH